MSQQRLEQLSVAYSELTGSSYVEARRTILRTPTGKAIAEGRQAILYEQHTANLYCIVSELNLIETRGITTEMIQSSVEKSFKRRPATCPCKFAKATPAQKRQAKNRLRRLQKQQLKKMQSYSKDILALGRALNAD